jgi:AmpE protein
MFTTLAAVLVALALGHVARPLPPRCAVSTASGVGWAGWTRVVARPGRDRPALPLALLPPLLLMALLAWLLRGVLFGLPSLLLGVAVLAWCWGLRDLDRDIEAIIDADDAATRQAAVTCRRPAAACARTFRHWSRRPCSTHCGAGSRCCSGSCCWARPVRSVTGCWR